MKRVSTDPRPPINQGIDTNNATVLRHNAIYNGALSTITEGMQIVGLMVNPYGTAPLSGYLGIWSPTANPIRVQLTNDVGAIPVDYSYTPEPGANLVPLLGLVPAALNHLTVTIPGVGTATGEIITTPLPPSDAEIPPEYSEERFPPFSGFPVYEVTVPAKNPPATLSELYFTAYFIRHFNVGVDHNGTVRWYTTKDMYAFNFIRLTNGHFLHNAGSTDRGFIWHEFDMVGRVHKAYILDNETHHSLYQMPDGNILATSGQTGADTVADGITIIDLSTGLEIAYYDTKEFMDVNRVQRPSEPGPDGGQDLADWMHLNQNSYDATNNLILSSGRHQGVFANNKDTGELVFILASHDGWGEEFRQYLLTPIDESGAPLYDLSDPAGIDAADKEFWPWGQHAIIDLPSDTQGISEFYLLDNGNFRSRQDENSLLPNDNFTRVVHYRVDIQNKTVQLLFEYGREVGARGYSSWVSNAYLLENGNYLINYGAALFDENGRTLTEYPGFSDIVDPQAGNSAMHRLVLQEVDPVTREVQIEFTVSSGRYKDADTDGAGYRYDMFSFRAHKLPLLP